MKTINSSRYLPLKGLLVLSLISLVGCASSGLESAYQLIEQQQSQQALVRKHEAEEWKKNTPKKREIALNTISETQLKGRYFASLAFIDAYTAEFGADAEVSVMQAEALRNTGQLEQSQKLYESLVAGSKGAFAYRGLGLLAGQQQNYTKAAEYLSAAVSLRPTDALLLSDLGFAQLRSGQLDQARISLGKAAELEPENAKVLSNLALYLLVNNQMAKADEMMSSLKLSPQVQVAVYDLAYEIQQEQAAKANTKVIEVAHGSTVKNSTQASAQIAATENSVVRNRSETSAASHSSHSSVPTPKALSSTTYSSAEAPFGFTNSRLIQ